jgi:hypothetical protein
MGLQEKATRAVAVERCPDPWALLKPQNLFGRGQQATPVV